VQPARKRRLLITYLDEKCTMVRGVTGWQILHEGGERYEGGAMRFARANTHGPPGH